MIEPKFRCSTNEAILKIAKELHLKYNSGMQDWEWEIANPKHIEKYIEHYKSLKDDDEKFTLMEIIIQALTDQEEEELIKYWKEVKEFLKANFGVHEYSIFYWSCFENENVEECWQITPQMRSLWKECNVG